MNLDVAWYIDVTHCILKHNITFNMNFAQTLKTSSPKLMFFRVVKNQHLDVALNVFYFGILKGYTHLYLIIYNCATKTRIFFS